MGYGNYSHEAHDALIAGRRATPRTEIFNQSSCHPLMNPRGLRMRESCDGPDHPNSLAIAFVLDVTGSMGEIPDLLARQELPKFMKLLTACQVADPQVLFMAVGDATSDQAPLQIGQFESTAELMDQWLTWSFLEGGGGGQNTESYELAFYTAAQHTSIDCFDRRKVKGYLFMTGDELPYPAVSRHQVSAIFDEKLDEDIPIEEAIAAAAESYHLFFLIPDLRRRDRCEKRWRQLLGDGVIVLEDPQDTCAVAALIVGLTEGRIKTLDHAAELLKVQGQMPERIGAILRAVSPYAELLKIGPVHRPRPVTDAGTPSSWWQRLFG
jgi:hypothetical protein